MIKANKGNLLYREKESKEDTNLGRELSCEESSSRRQSELRQCQGHQAR